MLETLVNFIKLAVDVERGIVAGGGELHADCEAVLLQDGSRQEMIWGADWIPSTQRIRFDALFNIRPKQGNPTMRIADSDTCRRITEIVLPLVEHV